MPTLGGQPITLVGTPLQVGDYVPNFTVLDNQLNEVQYKIYKDKRVKVISVVPSLDTPVCDQQTRRLNTELSKLADVVVLTISNDLPFAQGRWCGNVGLDNIITLSDYRDLNFAQQFGTLIKELRLQTRVVYVVNENDQITYVEYLQEITDHPNYDRILQKVKELL